MAIAWLVATRFCVNDDGTPPLAERVGNVGEGH